MSRRSNKSAPCFSTIQYPATATGFRFFWLVVVSMLCFAWPSNADEPLPVGSSPAPVAVSHFPSRLHAFVWRNWNLLGVESLAAVLKTTPENVAELAKSLGLPKGINSSSIMREKGYITLVRRNWHLLPYDQLLEVVGMTKAEFAFRLLEDDFLFTKLGRVKPRCAPLLYHKPTDAEQAHAARIKKRVQLHFGSQLAIPSAESRFEFVEQLSSMPDSFAESSLGRQNKGSGSTFDDEAPLRLIYSYFGSYGDPLNHPKSNPYPDGLLARLADVGVNGVWLHVVLRNMAPGGEDFPEFGAGHVNRLHHLRDLCKRAQRFGIRVFLYINEPRAMEPSFFEKRPEMAGVSQGGLTAMCTSDPKVRKWVEDSVAHMFSQIPELGGVFTITASENLTNCWCRGRGKDCPRCKQRSGDDVIAEINRVIEKGVHRGNPNAQVIVWDWGWHGHTEASSIIDKLPRNISLMSVSEWAKPIERGNIATKVGEYSVSAVGPGPRAVGHWQAARKNGQQRIAKVQFNTTWELSAVPYLPALNLVAQHCRNLQQHHVDAQMLSWTVGGYPSPNLQVAHRMAINRDADVETILKELARDLYGQNAAPDLTTAWSQFSRALQEFPFHVRVLYKGPQQMGPANLLYEKPTGYQATMCGIPYDDLKGWRGPYPEEVFVKQFELLASGWENGVVDLRKAVAVADIGKRSFASGDLRVAEAAGIHFRSVANQAQFVRLRDAWLERGTLEQQELQQIRLLINQEIKLAKQLWQLARQDSRLGFEASNHYYYVPLDLVEKVINCEYMLEQWTANPENHP